MFRSIFDLPSHVLFVHFPIVALPMVAIAAVAVALRPQWRRRMGWWVVGAAFIVAVSIWLASETGEEFDQILFENFPESPVERHAELAETTQFLSLGLVAASAAMMLVGRRFDNQANDQADNQTHNQTHSAETSPIVMGLAGLTVVFAALSTVWVVRTGHEGARVTWDGVVPAADARADN